METERRTARYQGKTAHDGVSRELKIFARSKAAQAIQRGTIQRGACAMCGGSQTQAHHEDYAKPLEVTFLCRKCHYGHHAERRRAARA